MGERESLGTRLVTTLHGGCDSVIRALTAQARGSDFVSQRLPVFNFPSCSAQNLTCLELSRQLLLLPVEGLVSFFTWAQRNWKMAEFSE